MNNIDIPNKTVRNYLKGTRKTKPLFTKLVTQIIKKEKT